MDDKFWEEYANNAKTHYNEEFAKFIQQLAVQLRCTSALEVGCNAGNDLTLFPESVMVHGLDSNQKIIDIAKDKFPSFDFKAGSATKLPYEDASIDFVFTHGFFNYLEDDDVSKVVSEMFRVAKRYIVNCEILGNDAVLDDDTGRKGRDMYKKWLDYEVKIISNVDMHEDIDSEKPRFVLVKKI